MIWLGIIYAIGVLVFYVWTMYSARASFPSVEVVDRIIVLGLSAVWPVTLAYILVMRARD